MEHIEPPNGAPGPSRTINGKSLQGTYVQGCTEREPFLRRAYQCAELTVPHLIFDPGSYSGAHTPLPTPFQSIGAQGLNHAASLLLLTLFPPSQPNFRLRLDPFVKEDLDEDEISEIEDNLSKIEQTVQSEMNSATMRPHLNEAIKQAACAGNVLLHIGDANSPKVHKLHDYVVKRDTDGSVFWIVLRERILTAMLDEEIRVALPEDKRDHEWQDIYTGVVRKGEDFEIWQEVAGMTLESSYGTEPVKETSWLPLWWSPVTGQSYGYGLVAEHMGDLSSLEGLMQALVEGAAASAKLLFMVNPAGTTDVQELANAPNGGFVSGNEADITTLKVDKAADMSVAERQVQELRRSLGQSFLLTTSIQRHAERVTATETRYLVQQLETGFAGVYALWTVSLLLPLVNNLLARLQEEEKIPEFDSELAQPTIITGLEALGRGHDLARLDEFITGAINTFGPEALLKYVDLRDYLQRRATALSLTIKGLIRSEEEIQEMEQQASNLALAQQFTPELAKAAGQALQPQSA